MIFLLHLASWAVAPSPNHLALSAVVPRPRRAAPIDEPPLGRHRPRSFVSIDHFRSSRLAHLGLYRGPSSRSTTFDRRDSLTSASTAVLRLRCRRRSPLLTLGLGRCPSSLLPPPIAIAHPPSASATARRRRGPFRRRHRHPYEPLHA